MTSLSDFPPDVQAAASKAHAEFASSQCSDNLGVIIARAIVADRCQRINVTGLTTQQAACLKAIAEHQARTGLSPTHDELRVALGLASKSGVSRLLHWLESRGRILRPANQSRAITIISTPSS
ncbi:LexA family protein [Devosia lacusdianchii]|uniref:LexA family protein n=1 Tax=Devosia lacusdianchii TaxID=2917991 RepID=UPI001F060E3D|nr:hypothetical protein [Devosia sp. JXJ CY 41]